MTREHDESTHTNQDRILRSEKWIAELRSNLYRIRTELIEPRSRGSRKLSLIDVYIDADDPGKIGVKDLVELLSASETSVRKAVADIRGWLEEWYQENPHNNTRLVFTKDCRVELQSNKREADFSTYEILTCYEEAFGKLHSAESYPYLLKAVEDFKEMQSQSQWISELFPETFISSIDPATRDILPKFLFKRSLGYAVGIANAAPASSKVVLIEHLGENPLSIWRNVAINNPNRTYRVLLANTVDRLKDNWSDICSALKVFLRRGETIRIVPQESWGEIRGFMGAMFHVRERLHMRIPSDDYSSVHLFDSADPIQLQKVSDIIATRLEDSNSDLVLAPTSEFSPDSLWEEFYGCTKTQ